MTRDGASSDSSAHPHDGQPIETAGAPPQAAEAAVIMLHGRGSSARWFRRLIDEFLHHGVMYLAPQAAHRSWYPYSAAAALEDNEPWVSSALDQVSTARSMAADAGVSAERTLILGFSQGASLASEFVVRTPRRYGGLVVLSGSLLGSDTDREYDGSIDGTPVFLGCGVDDSYVPAERVHESARVFDQLGGEVDKRLYEELDHAINDDEISVINAFVDRLV